MTASFFKCVCILNIIFFVSFENMRVSALSLNKKQSSAYSKYACGCFLYAPSIYSAYLQKANGSFFRKVCFSSGTDANAQKCTRMYISELRVFHWKNSILFGTTDVLSAVAMFCHKAKLMFFDRHGYLSENDISIS